MKSDMLRFQKKTLMNTLPIGRPLQWNRCIIGCLPVKGEDTIDFSECMRYCDLEEIPSSGSKYTWSNRQGHGSRIYSKLDWAFSNIEWMPRYGTKTLVVEEGIPDHSPLILTTIDNKKHKSMFMYCDMWSIDPAFNDMKEIIWKYLQFVLVADKQRRGGARLLGALVRIRVFGFSVARPAPASRFPQKPKGKEKP
ncbi:hypothetical protein DM860_002180 [Cuscuta australis]|uniref:Endonuclease/exonuclease/phosphatase domain-containing protein n=1 Tax=Cuscuta australis TaxID=267555 RepID=A0A328DZW2_9ASTE|nr:hypothetical protein DM860_002180 [Cuscuta australis]